MKRSEKETREKLIDPKLKLAGWEILTQKNIIEKGKACIETKVTNIPKTSENASGNGYVDYILFGDDCKPLAIIEAKKSTVNEENGKIQACLYADSLEKQYGIRPIIYYTNGYTIKIIDGIYDNPREVFGFHKKEELEYLIQKRNYKIVDDTPNSLICGRYYQKDAISEIIKRLESKKSRSLIVLATGTGKTRTACGLSDIFIRNNYVKRILFLADRKNLVKQAKEETFDKYLTTVPTATIIEGKHDGSADARIIFSTYQSMISMIRDTSKCPFGIGHFDLIIIDEAHRSLFNKYSEIFDYFDALMIGLTATPRNDIHKSTYKVFDITSETPAYEYDVVKAVKDGFLVYFRALDRTPNILKNGLTYKELTEDEKEQYEELFTDDDGILPEKIEGEKFYSAITNRDTIRKVLSDLMEEGIKVNNGILGKTIIFARDHNHALLIQEEFRNMYPEFHTNYCVVIDNKIRYNEVLQREFKNKQDIRIVVSVDMMDTGVDIPEVVNLVFFKRVLSKIKFWQMIGRGTRLCENLKVISPSKSYFERQINDNTRQLYNNKQGFLIFDVCNVFEFFNLKSEGKKDNSNNELSLNQKIFMKKVDLYKTMQNKYYTLDNNDRTMYINLRDELINEIKNLNKNYIGVQKSLKQVEKYSNVLTWTSFDSNKFKEIKTYIAPNIIGVIDKEESNIFDSYCYEFSKTKLLNDKNFKEVAEKIYNIARILDDLKNQIPEILKKEDIIAYIQTNDFLKKTSVSEMENIRLEIRELMKYIEKEIEDTIISDFNDEISSTNEIEDNILISTDDFKTPKEKFVSYINKNKNNNLVYKIINLEKYSKNDIELFKQEIIKILNKKDYDFLFESDEDIVILIRKSLEINPIRIQHFLDNQKSKGRTEEQITYIKELLSFIAQNGCFSKSDLLREELMFGDLFNNIEILDLISDIEEIL